MVRGLFVACAVFGSVTHAQAWDPLGDLRNPGRILENAKREVGVAGNNVKREAGVAAAEAARIAREGLVQIGAPTFENWLLMSRSTALHGSKPIPPEIVRRIGNFFPPDVLNGVRYKVGDNGEFNLANLSTTYGHARAVALIDLIVFRIEKDALTNATMWAHELKHVQQFREWGIKNFAIRYLRDWNAVEGEAKAAEEAFRKLRR